MEAINLIRRTLHQRPKQAPSLGWWRGENTTIYTVEAINLIRRTLHLRPRQAPSSGLFASYALQHTPQQTHHPEPSALPSSQAFREEGQTNRYTRNIRLYRDISFDMHRSPCRQERSESRVGGAGRAIARTEGVIPSSSGLFASYALQHTPQQTLHPVASRHPSSQTFQEEGAFYRYTRWKL